MRARKTKSFQNLSFRNDFNIKTSKTQWFFKKMSKFHPARSCGIFKKPMVFQHVRLKICVSLETSSKKCSLEGPRKDKILMKLPRLRRLPLLRHQKPLEHLQQHLCGAASRSQCPTGTRPLSAGWEGRGREESMCTRSPHPRGIPPYSETLPRQLTAGIRYGVRGLTPSWGPCREWHHGHELQGSPQEWPYPRAPGLAIAILTPSHPRAALGRPATPSRTICLSFPNLP